MSPCPPETGSPGVCLLAALAVCADGTGTGAALLEAGVQRPGAGAPEPEPRQVPVPAAAAGRPGRQRRGADRMPFSRTRTAAQNYSCRRRRFASMEESSFNTISPGQLKRNTGWFPAEVALRGGCADWEVGTKRGCRWQFLPAGVNRATFLSLIHLQES